MRICYRQRSAMLSISVSKADINFSVVKSSEYHSVQAAQLLAMGSLYAQDVGPDPSEAPHD